MTAPPPADDNPRAIILDCDPGIDDALAILFACGHPGLELRGLTTVAGNVGLARTTANALSVLELAGCPDVPVVAGSDRPLLRPPRDASRVHGESGLGQARLPRPAAQPSGSHAVDFLTSQIGAAPGQITLVATGPLTNIAHAVRREPRIVSQVRDFVIMGGSAGPGNVTAAAEFNIAADPEAAAIVFGAGWRVTMVGLDVTLQARATAEIQDRMRDLGRLGSDLLLPGLAGYEGEPPPPPLPVPGALLPGPGALPPGLGALPPVPGASSADLAGEEGPAVHDVCALALVAEPHLFGCLPARVEVETTGRWTAGMTVTDFRPRAADPNALVVLSMDVPAFWDVVLGAYARIPAAAR